MTSKELLSKWLDYIPEMYKELFTTDCESMHGADEPNDARLLIFVQEWLALWPKAEELAFHGQQAKMAMFDPNSINTKMVSFIKRFKIHTGRVFKTEVRLDIVMRATKMYLDKFRNGKSDWTYLHKPDNFITKMGKSELSAHVNQIITDDEKPKTSPVNKTDQSLKFA